MNKAEDKNSIVLGIIAAIIVFLCGFFTMYIMWIKIGNPYNVIGFFYYKAATWGDGLLLPIMIFSLVGLSFSKKIYAFRNLKLSLVTAFSGVVAVAIQASWLWNKDTVLNWSIPIPHFFNIAGWYHSLFFILMICVSTFLIERLIIWYGTNRDILNIKNGILFVLFIMSGSSFLQLHFYDDYKNITHAVSFNQTYVFSYDCCWFFY